MKSTIALCLMMIVGIGWGQKTQWDEGLEPILLWGYSYIHEYPERTWQTNFDMRCGFLYHDPCPIRFNFDIFMAPGFASWEEPNVIIAERNPVKHHIVCTSHTHHLPTCEKGK